jgi:signal transduction histidine kinase
MNSILGTTYLLKETALNDIQKRYVQKIENGTNRLLQLINDILDFSKLEAHKLELSQTSFSLIELLDELNNLFNQQMYEKSLKFKISYAPSFPMHLYGDNQKLLQILINLLSNAVKFTHEGKVTLYIEHSEEKLFRFSVIDTGIGIKEKEIANIFLSFTQSDSNITRKYGGSGLGLAISKELVELMGGTIWVNSRYAKGSKFIFEIPLTVEDDKVMPVVKKELDTQIKIEETYIDKHSAKKVEELFAELKEAAKKSRPQLCKPIVEVLEVCEMTPQESVLFDRVKALLKKYKFTQAGELL